MSHKYLTPPPGIVDAPGSGRSLWGSKPALWDGPRTAPLTIRATAKEMAALRRAAKDAGVTPSEYLRRAICSALSGRDGKDN